MCGGGETTVIAPPAPGPSAEEKRMYQLMIEQMEKPPSEYEQAMEEYGLEFLEQQMEAMPLEKEFREQSIALMQEQIAYSRQQLENLASAKEMGEMTGDLTDEEIRLLDEMETSAVTQLTTAVNRQLEDVMGKEMASLVSRGVLQGGIGAEAMAKLGERSLEIIGTGTAGIGTTRMGQELGMIERKRQFELNLQSLVQQGVLTREQATQQMAMGAVGMGQVGQQMGMQAGQFGAQLGQEWDIAQLGAGLQAWGTMGGWRQSQADRALQAAMATSQARASQTAAMWGGLGSVAGLGAMGWASGGFGGGGGARGGSAVGFPIP